LYRKVVTKLEKKPFTDGGFVVLEKEEKQFMEPLNKKDFEEILEQQLEQKLEVKLTEQSREIEKMMSGITSEIISAVDERFEKQDARIDEKFTKLGAQLDLQFMDLKSGLKSEFVTKQELQNHVLAGHK